MTIDLKKRAKKVGVFKRRAGQKKIRSVPSLIAENRRALQKLKPEESSDDSDNESMSDQGDDRGENEAKKSKVPSDDEDAIESGESDSEEDEEEGGDADLFDDKQHKKSLAKLKETDPEFYQFLEENDKKLLQFNVSDSESDGQSDEEDKVHKPPVKLEVDSDEDDFEEGEAWTGGTGQLITLAMVTQWQHDLRTQVTVHMVTQVVKAFQAALQTVSGQEGEDSEYRVDGSSVFNAVVQLCVVELQPALVKLLDLRQRAHAQPAKSKRWNKVKVIIKNYMTDLLKLLGSVSSANIVTVLLKHLHQMTMFLGYYHSLTRAALKLLVGLWSTAAEETVRVVAFLCVLRLTTNQPRALLDSVLKMMYVAYISNSKFVSVSTLPNINFMRRSLSEMFCLDSAVSYQHTFLYIRQLAIHLRNAITVHKKESIQAVCNWQYMNSLRLWVDLLSTTDDKSPLRALLYPLVQVILGCIKLVSTAQYLPLRFHCCQLLTKLSQDTNTYIPVLPFIVESLTLVDFNKKYKKVSMKPMDLTCVLRVSKSGLTENGFRDTVVEQVYQLLIEYCTTESHRISFPDIIVPAAIQLKSFVRECRTSKYSQKLKQALAKIEENGRFIEGERRKVTLSLADMSAVNAWELSVRARDTPLTTFYQSWKKVQQRQAAKRATDNDKLGDFKIPQIKRPSVKKETAPNTSGPVELFPSDSDSDNLGFGNEEDKPKQKRKKKAKQSKKTAVNIKEDLVKQDSESDSFEDIVEELRLSDLD